MTDEVRRLALGVVLPGFVGVESPPSWVLHRLDEGLGGVVLFGRNARDRTQVRALVGRLRAVRPDVVVGIDEEGGDVTRLEATHGSSHPGALALGAVDDESLTYEVARAIGADLVDADVDLNLAPCADVNVDPRNPVIGVRSFGADATTVSRHTVAYVRGLQSTGVAACVKHFPGHGDTAADSHVDLPVVHAPREEVLHTHVAPFRSAVEAGARAVMSAHVVVPALDGDGPATASPRILTELLRGELGFGGAVVTDALEMAGASAGVGMGEAAVRALLAGADTLCLGGEEAAEHVVDEVVASVVAAVSSGRLTEQRLAGAQARTAGLRRLAATDALPPHDARRALGADAARRAVRVAGALPVRLDDALVAEVATAPSIAVGPVPWGVGSLVAERVTGVRTVEVDLATASADALVHQAAGRPLVVVTRDAGRHAAALALLRALAVRRPDVVHVEMGVPGPVVTQARVDAHGAGLASRRAVADLLVGRLAPTGATGRTEAGAPS